MTRSCSWVTGEEAGADAVISQGSSGETQLTTTYDRWPVGEPHHITNEDELVEFTALVADFARSAFLRKLNPNDSTIDVRLSLVPGTWTGQTPCGPQTVDTTRYENAQRLLLGTGRLENRSRTD